MKIHRIILLFTVFAGAVSLSAYEPRVTLSGRKDRVISKDERAVVLDVATGFMNRGEGDFLARAEAIGDPFSFKEPEGSKSSGGVITVDRKPQVIEYDDASLLAAVVPGFSNQVRGYLMRGDGYFLQLAGGNLLRVGESFPVRLPGIQDKGYRVLIAEITDQGYTLQLNEVSRFVPYEGMNAEKERAVRYISE